jgi:hypothetical protein
MYIVCFETDTVEINFLAEIFCSWLMSWPHINWIYIFRTRLSLFKYWEIHAVTRVPYLRMMEKYSFKLRSFPKGGNECNMCSFCWKYAPLWDMRHEVMYHLFCTALGHTYPWNENWCPNKTKSLKVVKTRAEAKLMTSKINVYHCRHKVTNTVERVVEADVTLITNSNNHNNSIQLKCLRPVKSSLQASTEETKIHRDRRCELTLTMKRIQDNIILSTK